MKLLVVTNHFYRPATVEQARFVSQVDPLARIAAVNAMMIAFNRYFGGHRHRAHATNSVEDDLTERKLDFVILQSPGLGLLDKVGIDPSTYNVEYFNGDPMMLGFEAQRVIRERIGQYDYYAVVEDDMIVGDPEFFNKLAWFEATFGPDRILQPFRYEMSQSALPAVVACPNELKANVLAPFRREGQSPTLSGKWAGREQTFRLSRNPHIGGYFVSDDQLRKWVKSPYFYDKDSSWVGPLEASMSLSIGRTFDLYQPSAPDPYFLSIEHYGTRHSEQFKPQGVSYGDSPLLGIAHRALMGETHDDLFQRAARGMNQIMAESMNSQEALASLLRSRSKLFRAFCRAMMKPLRGSPG